MKRRKQAPLPIGEWEPCPVCQTLHDRGKRGERETCSATCRTIRTTAANTGRVNKTQQRRSGIRGTNLRAEWA